MYIFIALMKKNFYFQLLLSRHKNYTLSHNGGGKIQMTLALSSIIIIIILEWNVLPNDSSDILSWGKQWNFGPKELKCEMYLELLKTTIVATQRGASRKLWVSTWSCEVISYRGGPTVLRQRYFLPATILPPTLH